MSARARAAAALLLAALCGASAAPVSPPPTYLLTQAMCLPLGGPRGVPCQTQTIAVGSLVQLQLPGTPSVWSVARSSLLAGTYQPVRVPSQGRITGADEVWIFTFAANRRGADTLLAVETPPFLTRPTGTFKFPLVVR
jgi:hypothetical protein